MHTAGRGVFEYSPDSDADGTPDWLDPDDDGVIDEADCAPLDPLDWGLPQTVTGLVVEGPDVLSWAAQPPDLTYDVAAGALSDLLADGDTRRAVCVRDDAPEATWSEGVREVIACP